MKNTYNGWTNRATWNISLWINNDYSLYQAASDFMRDYKGYQPYRDFIKAYGMENDRTPDRFQYLSTKLSFRELNAMMRELAA